MDIREYIKNAIERRDRWKPKEKDVIIQGIEEGVYFYVEESDKRYVISSPSKETLKLLDTSELINLLPKFGKYEIEAFFMERFLTALLITGDMTKIFNTTVYVADYYSHDVYFSAERVKKRFLDTIFEVVKEDRTIVKLKLKINKN